MSRSITITDNLFIGMEIRFSHPDYSYSGEKGLEKLTLNEDYIVQDYMIYTDGVSFILFKFPGVQFDSKLFTLSSNNYIIPYGRRRTKFFVEKLKLRVRLWWCRK
ncbi:MAG: hypothetical protein PHG66_04420 [Candidatus Colwellbacteria bacterium]|nr:hypothetical protein [Candidatus Colwellbacteria bacterium]